MAPLHYDVIVIGSGFGGAVPAMRAVEKGYRVGVMEAGKRWRDEALPKTSWDVRRFAWEPEFELFGIQRATLPDLGSDALAIHDSLHGDGGDRGGTRGVIELPLLRGRRCPARHCRLYDRRLLGLPRKSPQGLRLNRWIETAGLALGREGPTVQMRATARSSTSRSARCCAGRRPQQLATYAVREANGEIQVRV